MTSLRRVLRTLTQRKCGPFLLLLLCVPRPAAGQNDAPVQRLYEHLSGTWTGVHHDYTAASVIEIPVTIHVSSLANKEWLQVEYLFTPPPEVGKPVRREEHDAYYLSSGVLVRDFLREGDRSAGLRLQLNNLQDVLRDGFGDYTATSAVMWMLRHTSERIEYHLHPGTWSFETYVKLDDGTWLKTSDFDLKRTSPVP